MLNLIFSTVYQFFAINVITLGNNINETNQGGIGMADVTSTVQCTSGVVGVIKALVYCLFL